MSSFTPAELALFLTALVAAMVNGALGYGFSSITVPVALGFVANRVLNPALVLLEVVLTPLALLLDNQGLAQDGFRAAIALIRVAESSLTLVMYLFLGFHGAPSLGLLQQLGWVDRAVSYAVSVAIGGFIMGSAWQRFLLLRKSQVASS
jgi:hypothetical protein